MKNATENMTRRNFVKQSTFAGVGTIAITSLAGAELIWEDNALQVNRLEFTSPRLPEAFDGFVIAQVSDFHNKTFVGDEDVLVNAITAAEPDAIFITGDIVDRNHYNLEVALDFIDDISPIAPIYYVTGNHEHSIAEYDRIISGLLTRNVIVLEDETVDMKRDDSCIAIAGIKDPIASFTWEQDLIDLLASSYRYDYESRPFTVLLSHRPERFTSYVSCGVDLVFSGHAHGGQIRLPIIGPLYSPHQGFLPTYTTGLYHKDSTTMIVSRGLGNSIFPIRFNNRPELVIATLKTY